MSKALRVIHIVRKMDIGGVQLMLMNYYRNINKELLQFDFIVQGSEEGFFDKEIKELGGIIYNVTPMSKSIIKYNKEVKELFSKYKYKIVHIHHNYANIYAATQAHKTKREYIISHSHAAYKENSILKRVAKSLIKLRLNKVCDYKFACSKDAGEWLYGRRQIKNGNVVVLSNAINVDDFKYNEDIRKLKRRELKLTNNFVVGHIGSFSETKNHDFLIEIFNYICSKNSESRLVLVGEGKLKDKLKDKVRKLGLEQKVLFLGSRLDIGELTQAFDVLLFPSTSEGLGMVLIESQASGLRCIASTSVSNETDLTGLVDYISLDESIEFWGEQVLKYSAGYKRRDTSQQIKNGNYDITKQAKLLEKFYLSLNN